LAKSEIEKLQETKGSTGVRAYFGNLKMEYFSCIKKDANEEPHINQVARNYLLWETRMH